MLRTLVYREQEVAAHDGCWYRVRIMPYRTLENRIDGVVITFIDVTERTRALLDVQASLDAVRRLKDLSLKFVRSNRLEDFLGDILEAAMEVTKADFGTIHLLDPDTGGLRIVSHRGGFPDWWLEFWRNANDHQGCCGIALERNERLIIEDVEQSPVFAGTPALEVQLRAGIRAVQSTPLVSRAGRTVGVFSTHYKQPQRPDDRALALLDVLARPAADMIDQSQTVEKLRKSQGHLQFLVDHIPVALAMFDTKMRYLALSQRWREKFSIGEQNVRGRTHDEVCPACPEHWRKALQRALTGEVVYPQDVPFERPDGSEEKLRWEVRPWTDPDGNIGGILIEGADIAKDAE